MELLQRRYGQDATNTGERKAVWTGLRKKCCCVRREGGKEEVGMAYLSLSPLLPGPAQALALHSGAQGCLPSGHGTPPTLVTPRDVRQRRPNL